MTRKRLKMKDLEAATGVGREAIRFYIRQGLLPEPERPGRNVAWYDEAFVDRVLLIKELQRKRYLPLHAIKAIVGSDTPPSWGEVQALIDLDGKLFRNLATPQGERLSHVAKRTGLRAAEIRVMAEVEAIEIVTRDGDQWLEGDGVRMVELWAALRRTGFTDDLGFGPQRLALYVDFVRWLAREELRLFSQGVAGRVDTVRSGRMAEEGIDRVNEMIGLLRKGTLLRYIAEGNVPAEAEPPPAAATRRSSR